MLDNIIVIFEVFFRQFIWLAMPARRTQEILMLRKELQVLQRSVKRPRLNLWDRLFFVSLFRLGNGVVDNIVTIKPSTVLAWHRKLAARKWTYRQKPNGRPATEDEVRQLVIEMKTNNRRWGAGRIVGELRKLGKIISKSTVFFTVDTAFFKRLYVFALMDIKDCPKFIVSDRDGIYGEWLGTFLKDCYDITLYRTPPGMPNCNAFIERWNRSVREELLDHRIVFGERDLRSLLKEYVEYSA